MMIARRTLGIGRKQLYALKDKQDQITNNRDEVIKVVEEFYRKLYSSNDEQTEDTSMETMNIEVPCVNMSEKHQKKLERTRKVQMAY